MQGDAFGDDPDEFVGRADFEVGLRNLAIQGQQGCLVGGDTRAHLRPGGFGLPAQAPPEIDLVGGVQRYGLECTGDAGFVVGDRRGRNQRDEVGIVGVALGQTAGIDFGVEIAGRYARDGLRLQHTRGDGLEIGVLPDGLDLKAIQHRVFEYRPPVAPPDGVLGNADLPGFGLGELRRYGNLGPNVVGPDGLAGRKEREDSQARWSSDLQGTHHVFAAGTTRDRRSGRGPWRRHSADRSAW